MVMKWERDAVLARLGPAKRCHADDLRADLEYGVLHGSGEDDLALLAVLLLTYGSAAPAGLLGALLVNAIAALRDVAVVELLAQAVQRRDPDEAAAALAAAVTAAAAAPPGAASAFLDSMGANVRACDATIDWAALWERVVAEDAAVWLLVYGAPVPSDTRGVLRARWPNNRVVVAFADGLGCIAHDKPKGVVAAAATCQGAGTYDRALEALCLHAVGRPRIVAALLADAPTAMATATLCGLLLTMLEDEATAERSVRTVAVELARRAADDAAEVASFYNDTFYAAYVLAASAAPRHLAALAVAVRPATVGKWATGLWAAAQTSPSPEATAFFLEEGVALAAVTAAALLQVALMRAWTGVVDAVLARADYVEDRAALVEAARAVYPDALLEGKDAVVARIAALCDNNWGPVAKALVCLGVHHARSDIVAAGAQATEPAHVAGVVYAALEVAAKQQQSPDDALRALNFDRAKGQQVFSNVVFDLVLHGDPLAARWLSETAGIVLTDAPYYNWVLQNALLSDRLWVLEYVLHWGGRPGRDALMLACGQGDAAAVRALASRTVYSEKTWWEGARRAIMRRAELTLAAAAAPAAPPDDASPTSSKCIRREQALSKLNSGSETVVQLFLLHKSIAAAAAALKDAEAGAEAEADDAATLWADAAVRRAVRRTLAALHRVEVLCAARAAASAAADADVDTAALWETEE